MYILKSAQQRIEEHAIWDPVDRVWKCKTTGAHIQTVGTRQSIHVFGFYGGFGEVRMVLRPYCPACETEPTVPEYGTPIQESELLEVR